MIIDIESYFDCVKLLQFCEIMESIKLNYGIKIEIHICCLDKL